MRHIGLAIWLQSTYRRVAFIDGIGEIPSRRYWVASPLIQLLWRDALLRDRKG